MDKFNDLKINSFRKNNSFSKDEEKKRFFYSLDKNSLFLKRVIEIKERERNLSKKILDTKSMRFDNKNENSKNFETLPNQPLSKIYKNPQYFQSLLIKTKAEYPNRRKVNNYSPNNKDIAYQNTSNKLNKYISNSSNNKRLNLSFHRIYRTNNFLSKYTMNPYFSSYLICNSNKNDFSKCKTESRVLSFNGRKMFAPLSLSKKNNKIDSPNFNENKSELYRNYHELNLKKEEIYKRKLKQNLSVENRSILRIKKNKDIKQQTIDNLTITNNLNRAKFLNKIKKIPKGNKKLKYIKKENYSKTIEESKNNNNSFLPHHKKDKKHIVTINNNNYINVNNLTLIKNRKNNNIKYIKKISSTKNNNKDNKYVFNVNDENKENICQNIINGKVIKNQALTFNVFPKINYNKTIPKNIIVGNKIKESIFQSKDNKLALKIHTLKNLNQIFSKKTRFNSILSMERFNFCISNQNYSITNNKYMIAFPSKTTNYKKKTKLSSIEE